MDTKSSGRIFRAGTFSVGIISHLSSLDICQYLPILSSIGTIPLYINVVLQFSRLCFAKRSSAFLCQGHRVQEAEVPVH
ncbi:MAG: hypothetical protein IIY60_01490, partial [Clostridia bacterium]|nr:hypothetical protein [Clostridia bacterium]